MAMKNVAHSAICLSLHIAVAGEFLPAFFVLGQHIQGQQAAAVVVAGEEESLYTNKWGGAAVSPTSH
eukprot:1161571-Pelagomonas_calceolata.AAC.2